MIYYQHQIIIMVRITLPESKAVVDVNLEQLPGGVEITMELEESMPQSLWEAALAQEEDSEAILLGGHGKRAQAYLHDTVNGIMMKILAALSALDDAYTIRCING